VSVLICDFSKEQHGALKMILGSKHVGAILIVLMWEKKIMCALIGMIKSDKKFIFSWLYWVIIAATQKIN